MGANADTIWKVPVYLPYLQPPLTDEAVASAEKQIGHRLPDEYLGLLRKQNGGYIRFRLPEMIHDTIAGIGPHFPALTQWSFRHPDLVPFDGDGHWYVCLDYRQNSAIPSVTYVDIECDRSGRRDSVKVLGQRLADSFRDYLALLQIHVGHEYVLETVADIETVKSHLSSVLSLNFYPPDSDAHGYPTHRAGLGTKDNPEWIWISPNTVPRGFVRANDRRYSELKDLMPGYADLFPELPAQSYILSATDEVRSRVIDACIQSQLIVRSLREYVNGI